MKRIRYRIPLISVPGLLACAKPSGDGSYRFCLSRAETASVLEEYGETVQEENALFFQTMCVLHGDAYTEPAEDAVLSDLSGVLLYMDFAGVFDHDTRAENMRNDRKGRNPCSVRRV